MAFLPKLGTETPYVEFEVAEVTSRDVQSRFSLKRFPALSLTVVKTLGCAAYILFLAWQVIGLVLYSIRVYETTLYANHTSYQVTNIKTYQFSEQLELAWVISQILNTGLMILAISKVPSFLGYFTILRLLVRLPSYWRLLSLYGISIVRYFLFIGMENNSGIEIALMLGFMVWEGVHVTFIGFLNFTQVNFYRKKYPFIVFAFFKFNIFVLFLSFFVKFVFNSLQLALHIYGNDGISSEYSYLIGTIRHFTSVVFKHKIYNFLFEKLFVDNRNILCHHDYLDKFT